ncbi:MAG: hypothetical protein HOP18_14775 [Deltaproteobacteria bacterium]|nr:hypothetical protein [Deltaproteobacteria bacterium]
MLELAEMKKMEELELVLNRSTKLVLRDTPGRSVLMEVRRMVNSAELGYGWLVCEQAFLEEDHVVALSRYLAEHSLNRGSSETDE